MKTKIEVKVQTTLAAIQTSSAPIVKKLNNLTIKDNSDYARAAEYMKTLKLYKKQAEDFKAKIIDPLKQSISETQKFFAPFISLVDTTDQTIKQQMLDFANKQEEAKAKLLRGKTNNVNSTLSKLNALEVKSDVAQIRQILELAILDVDAIPRKYLVPNESLIKADLKAGKKVKGCELKVIKSIAI